MRTSTLLAPGLTGALEPSRSPGLGDASPLRETRAPMTTSGKAEIVMPGDQRPGAFLADTAFYVAALMAAFAMLYGTRHIDATERHDGMVAAIAFESIVKLAAFLAVGVFVTYFMFDGLADIFAQAAARPDIAPLFTTVGGAGYGGWVTLILLSMAAILALNSVVSGQGGNCQTVCSPGAGTNCIRFHNTQYVGGILQFPNFNTPGATSPATACGRSTPRSSSTRPRATTASTASSTRSRTTTTRIKTTR